mgnify:CR=1 FL=1
MSEQQEDFRLREPHHEPVQRVLLASSAGGHLAQLVRLEAWYSSRDVRWSTFDLPDARSMLSNADVVWAHHPTTRNVPNLLRNVVLAFREIRAHRPDVVISSGAGIAIPFFWIAKLFRAKTIYVEVIDRFDTRTLTARLVSPVTDLFVVQCEDQLDLFPGSHLIGRLL